MWNAFFETTYASFVRMYYQKTFDGMLATPLSLEEIILAEIVWSATKATAAALIMLGVLGAVRLRPLPLGLLVPLAFLGGLAFGAIGHVFHRHHPTIDMFNLPIFSVHHPHVPLQRHLFPGLLPAGLGHGRGPGLAPLSPGGATAGLLQTILRWVDSEAGLGDVPPEAGRRVEWLRILPFIILHGMCLGVIWVGWSWAAVLTAAALYFIRMFAITGFYHRYFSHRTYKTNRFWQFIFAVLGNSAVQRGPLWWASHHRHHHRFADTDEDPHSPTRHGFWWSHIGWLTSAKHFPTRTTYVKDWSRYPELVWLNRFDTLVPVLLAAGSMAFGALLRLPPRSSAPAGRRCSSGGFSSPPRCSFTRR
jgi:hypothetical protein